MLLPLSGVACTCELEGPTLGIHLVGGKGGGGGAVMVQTQGSSSPVTWDRNLVISYPLELVVICDYFQSFKPFYWVSQFPCFWMPPILAALVQGYLSAEDTLLRLRVYNDACPTFCLCWSSWHPVSSCRWVTDAKNTSILLVLARSRPTLFHIHADLVIRLRRRKDMADAHLGKVVMFPSSAW